MGNIKKLSLNFFLTIFLIMVSYNNFVFSREINLKDIENYLNSISSLNSEIVQTEQNGNEMFGSLKLKKPGKLRIEYFNNISDHQIVGRN